MGFTKEIAVTSKKTVIGLIYKQFPGHTDFGTMDREY